MSDLNLAVIGNSAIAALVDRLARIVWCCFPRFDGDPIFCSLLEVADDPTGAGLFDIELTNLPPRPPRDRHARDDGLGGGLRSSFIGRTSRKERGHARDDGLGGGLGDCRNDGARRTRCCRADHSSATDSTAASDTISGASFDHRTGPTAGPDRASPASRVRCAARRGNNG
jgi:hypothetical protein